MSKLHKNKHCDVKKHLYTHLVLIMHQVRFLLSVVIFVTLYMGISSFNIVSTQILFTSTQLLQLLLDPHILTIIPEPNPIHFCHHSVFSALWEVAFTRIDDVPCCPLDLLTKSFLARASQTIATELAAQRYAIELPSRCGHKKNC